MPDPVSEGRVARAIRQKLEAAFAPERLVVVDESHLHAGHSGARDGGESHFRVEIVSSAFSGMTRLDRQRRINGVLAEELAGPVHALSLVARASAE